MRLAASARKAIELTENKQKKWREVEKNIALALTPEHRSSLGFTAQPFATI
jgi:hypothetical protein